MKRFFALLMLILLTSILWQGGSIVYPQTGPVPTLVAPTPLPFVPTPIDDSLLSESRLARIQRDGRLRVGMLFNEPPFGEMNVRGDIIGMDADLARAIAEAWGVELNLLQVTRQNAYERLNRGDVDMLIAAQVHRRDLATVVEFSHSYHIGKQAIMVKADDPATTLFNMANRRIGAVQGSAGERVLQAYLATSGLPLQAQSYLTLDLALRALFNGELDGIVESQHRLRRVASVYLDSVKWLDPPLEYEPFSIVMPRQDVNLRNLVNRTLQYLLAEGELERLHSTYFPGQPFSVDALPQWANIGDDAPRPAQFGTDVPYPTRYVVPRLQSERTLRIAGIPQDLASLSESERRVAQFHRSLVEQVARRWNVTVQLVEGDALALLASGQADLALGLPLDWNLASQVDFSTPYLLHGDRLMVKANSQIQGFNELRGRWIGIMHTDTGAQDRAQEWARSINATVRFYSTFEQDAARTLLEFNNADVIYGDSLKLIPHLEANPNALRLTERWYSRDYMAFAVPRNDLDFRLLVNYTLQELNRDGVLTTLWQPITPPNSEAPSFEMTPGSKEFLGFRLGT